MSEEKTENQMLSRLMSAVGKTKIYNVGVAGDYFLLDIE